MLNIMISRYGEQLGVLEWDSETGQFKGYAAEEVNACADFPQAHPAWPMYDKPARKDAAGLALLLACLGFDEPEQLASAAQAARAGKKEPPAHTVA